MSNFYLFFISMAMTVLLMPLAIRLAKPLHLLDKPNSRKQHVMTTPCVGGVVIALGSLLPVCFVVPLNNIFTSYFFGAMILCIFGLWDDRCDLNYRWKLLGQALAASCIVLWGELHLVKLPLLNIDAHRYGYDLISIVFIVAVINAVNFIDGLDGLAGGVVIISLSFLTLLGITNENVYVVVLSLSVMGSIFGFLRYNDYPARVFMGDTGSQFLGLSLVTLIFYLNSQFYSHASEPCHMLFPLLLVGVPLIDIVQVALIRIYMKKSVFAADRNHLHHRLIALGFSHKQAVQTLYCMQFILLILAYLTKSATVWLAFTILLGALIFALILHCLPAGILASTGKSIDLDHKKDAYKSILSYLSIYMVIGLLTAYIFIKVYYVSPLLPDVIYLMVFIIAFLLWCLYYSPHESHVLDRVSAYVFLSIMVFMPGAKNYLSVADVLVEIVFFSCLSIWVFLGVKYRLHRWDFLKPSDFLVFFVALLISLLPFTGYESPNDFGFSRIIYIVVLFYSAEFLILSCAAYKQWLRIAVLSISSLVLASSFGSL